MVFKKFGEKKLLNQTIQFVFEKLLESKDPLSVDVCTEKLIDEVEALKLTITTFRI